MSSVREDLLAVFEDACARIIAAHGGPGMKVGEFTRLRHTRRVVAVWLLDDGNHGISIDLMEIGGIKVEVWHHGADAHSATISTRSPEAAKKMLNLLIPEFFSDISPVKD
jgi:hypothetical protein